MKKLLIVNNHMHIGGVQKALVSFLQEIKDQYDITLFLFSSNGACYDQIPKEIKVVTTKSLYRCFGVSQAESRGFLKFCRSGLAVLTKLFGRSVAIFLANLSQQKLKEQYDVAISYLHSGGQKSFYGGCNDFVISKVKADKKVTFLHGDYSQCGSDHPKTNALYRRFDLVAACSEGCRQSFVSALPDMAERCVVVPNCHNYAKMRQDSLQDTVTYPSGSIHMLSIARMTREKGLERAITAVSYARKKGSDICYHIVGDGVERKNLEQLAEKLGVKDHVIFYGSQHNPYRFLPNADLLLISSYHEAAPLVIDEARCFGIPVLSTNTSSAEDMISKRELGWVCDNSQEALNQAMLNLLEDPTQLREKKIKIMRTECTNEAAVSAFNGIMR